MLPLAEATPGIVCFFTSITLKISFVTEDAVVADSSLLLPIVSLNTDVAEPAAFV